MLATFAANLSLSNSLITNTCCTTPMINHIHAHNVEGLSKNYQRYKIMKEYIVVNDLLPVKHVEKVSGKGYHTLFIGMYVE